MIRAPIKELLRRTNKYLLPVAERSWVVLLITFFACEFGHQYFTQMVQNMAEEGGSLGQIVPMLGDLLVSLGEYTVLTMLIPQRIMELDKNEPPGSFWAFTEKHVVPLTTESIRMLAMTILWAFALIIPGVIKYVRYTFVQYVVVADPEYAAGKVDALKESERLIKGLTGPLLIYLLLQNLLDYWQSSLRETHGLHTAPVVAFGLSLIFFGLNYYINCGLFVLYQMRKEKSSERGSDVTNVQLA